MFLSGCASVPDEISSEYYNIGNAYFDVKDYEAAADYYVKALHENHPMVNRIRYNLGIAYTESGRVKLGVEQFQVLLSEDPDNLVVLQSLAYAYYLFGDDDSSLAVYDRILGVFPYEETALYNKAFILLGLDRAEEAEVLLETLYEVEPSSEVAVLLGDLYKENGENDDFVIIYEEALLADAENSRIMEGLADYHLEEKAYLKSIVYIDRLVELESYSGKSEFLFKKAEILFFELDDYQGGFDAFVKAVDLGFDDEERIREMIGREELIDDSRLRDYLKVKGVLD